jgi:prepilin-type N-terminal cleavage/methylation domain-containing protein
MQLKDLPKLIIDKKAFTLTEVTVASLIIAILAAGTFSAFIGAGYIINRARHRIEAFNFARKVQDKLRSNYGYNDSEMDFGTLQASGIGVDTLGDLEPLTNEFTYKVFTYAEGSQADGYKKVEVTVGWDEPSF